MNIKPHNKASAPYFQAFYRHNRTCWAVTMFLTLLSVPLQLAVSWLLGAVIDAVATGELSVLRGLLKAAAGLTAGFAATELLETHAEAAFIQRALRQYKSLAFQNLSKKGVSAFARENTGRYISVLTNDIQSVEENYLSSSFKLVCQIVLFAGALVMMFWYSPALTLASVAFSALPLAVSLPTGGTLAKREKEVSVQNEKFVSQVKELLGGFSVIKSFKAEKEAQSLFNAASGEAENAKRRRRCQTGLVKALASTGGVVMQFGVFFIGAYLAVRGDITSGTVLVFVQMGNYLISPIQLVPQYLAHRKAAKGLVEKLAEVTKENAGRSGETIEPVLRDGIEFRDVSFGYESDKPVLKHISLHLEAGKKYALVGASGSGKSTLLNLLMGAYDGYQGFLSLDGKELKTVSPDSLYDMISLIGQSVFLFDDTIERNITLFRDFPAAQVTSAGERAGLTKLIAEKGADYRCGENGVNLSGGERQRVSIARSLLRKTPVLLLDEATAALDNESAFAVTDALLSLEGLTRLVVTHRLEKALLERYDEIFVLRDGQLWEQGDFHTLMNQKGYFYSLYTVAGT